MQLVGSVVELTGEIEFINNTVTNGAALFFTSFAQARLRPGLRVLFEGNVGRYVARHCSELFVVLLPYNGAHSCVNMGHTNCYKS